MPFGLMSVTTNARGAVVGFELSETSSFADNGVLAPRGNLELTERLVGGLGGDERPGLDGARLPIGTATTTVAPAVVSGERSFLTLASTSNPGTQIRGLYSQSAPAANGYALIEFDGPGGGAGNLPPYLAVSVAIKT